MRNDSGECVSMGDRAGGGEGRVGGGAGRVGEGERSEAVVIEGVEGMILEGEASIAGVKPRGKKNKTSSSSSSSGPLPLSTLCAMVKGHLLKERHGPNVAPMLVAFLALVKV